MMIYSELGFRQPTAAKNLAGSSGDDPSFFQNFNVLLCAFGAQLGFSDRGLVTISIQPA